MADKYAHLKKVKKKQKELQKAIDTIQLHHTDAYISAAKQHLLDDKNQIDYEKLKSPKLQLKMSDSITDYYIDKLEKKFKRKIDEVDKDDFLWGFYGLTRGILRGHATENKEKFTHDKYIKDIAQKIIKEIAARKKASAYSHLKADDIKDILDYTKTSEFVDPEKLTLEQAVEEILNTHHALGAVTRKMLKEAPYLIKEKKKKK